MHWRRGGERESYASVGYTLAVEDTVGTLRLQYQTGQPPERIDYAVRLVTTRCRLGGVRWWFTCPLWANGNDCGRRVRKLYLNGKYFGCRHCHGLTYTSCQESDSRVYAALRGGLDLGPFDDLGAWSVAKLGLALKVLTFEQKRQQRFDERQGRNGRSRGPTGDAES